MIGNDIVDRAQAKHDSNWQRKGFLNKVFTPEEQQLIYSVADPECMVWTLWSMKESAYKVAVRETRKRVFAPQKIVCHIHSLTEETAQGTIFYEKIYQTKSSITQQYITSIAVPATIFPILQQVIIPLDRADYQYQHTTIRKKIKQYAAAILSIPEATIYIKKDQYGTPTLSFQNLAEKMVNIPISISHHGHYGAYVIGRPPADLV